MSTMTVYVIEGNLDGKGWVAYGTLGTVTPKNAMEVYRDWQESRDSQVPSWGIRYRLVRRVITEDVILSEREGT